MEEGAGVSDSLAGRGGGGGVTCEITLSQFVPILLVPILSSVLNSLPWCEDIIEAHDQVSLSEDDDSMEKLACPFPKYMLWLIFATYKPSLRRKLGVFGS